MILIIGNFGMDLFACASSYFCRKMERVLRWNSSLSNFILTVATPCSLIGKLAQANKIIDQI